MSDGVLAFGDWDAPITDGAKWIDVPTHMDCDLCGEMFRKGDNGAIMPTGFAQHRECAFRSVIGGIGHHRDHQKWCIAEGDPDGGNSYRVSALLVWNEVRDKWYEPRGE